MFWLAKSLRIIFVVNMSTSVPSWKLCDAVKYPILFENKIYAYFKTLIKKKVGFDRFTLYVNFDELMTSIMLNAAQLMS